MGTSRMNSSTYATYSAGVAGMSRAEVFSERSIHSDMDPKGIEFREARDSNDNPHTTPIILGIDVTGSMGFIAEHIVKNGIGKLIEEIYERRPVEDPTVLITAIGDAECDEAPLQVGQFESDIVLTEWLEKIWLEGHGGGNDHESYDLPYYFAAYYTRTDAHDKGRGPGAIITIGDELPNAVTKMSHVQAVFGRSSQEDLPFADLIEQVRPMYTPYHIIASEGNFASRRLNNVKQEWREFLGNAAIVLDDHTKIAELIVSMLEVDGGMAIEESVSKWPEATRTVLMRSFSDIVNGGGDRLNRRMDIA